MSTLKLAGRTKVRLALIVLGLLLTVVGYVLIAWKAGILPAIGLFLVMWGGQFRPTKQDFELIKMLWEAARE